MVLAQSQVVANDTKKQLACLKGPAKSEHDVKTRVSNLVQGDSKGEVQAYVVMALRPGNDVTVMTSKEIKDVVKPLMHDWASSYLQTAHLSAGFVEDVQKEDNDDAITRLTTVNDTENLRPGMDPMPQLYRQPRPQVTSKSGFLRSEPKVQDWVVEQPFQIDDEEAVEKTLLSCLYYLQQTTLKKIAKAWIKGICPRKQTMFPYQDKRGAVKGKKREIPPWWPPGEVCIFREPDHVDRFQRMGVCLHFLRLRPTTEQLKEWNKNKNDIPLTTHREHEWVAFLEELAPPSIVDDVSPNDRLKAERRQKVLQKMYTIAKMEEQYKGDAIDGSTMVQPLSTELRKTSLRRCGTKRSRQCSESSDSADDDDSDSDDGFVPVVSNKKPKTSTVAKGTAEPEFKKQPKPRVATAAKPKRKATGTATRTNRKGDQTPDCKPDMTPVEQQAFAVPPYDARMQTAGGLAMGSTATTPLHTSFGSNMSDVSNCEPYTLPAASPIPEMHYAHHPLGEMHGVPVHQVYDVPHPQFDTVPNTLTFSSHDMMHFDQQHPSLGNGMAGLSIGTPAALPQPGAVQNTHYQGPVQTPHGLPSAHPQQQYKHWSEIDPSPFSYDAQRGIPSTRAQHAGVAVPQSVPGWAHTGLTHFHPHPNVHSDNDMGYNNLPYVPNHELPPASLPASVERGFTGHASGVGDSACPPGFPQYGF